ncbi:uncharacterized protein LOC144037848 isoform X2 [Vanacampus margaritifer]
MLDSQVALVGNFGMFTCTEASTIKEYCLHVDCCPSAEEKWQRVVKRIEAVWDMDGSALQECNWKAAFRQDGRRSWTNTQPTDSRLLGHVGWFCTPLTASCFWTAGEVASQQEQIVRP